MCEGKKSKCLNIGYQSESADEEFKSDKLLVDRFVGDFANGGERFGSEEHSQGGLDFLERFHRFGNQKRFEDTKSCVVESAKRGIERVRNKNQIEILRVNQVGLKGTRKSDSPSAFDQGAEEADLLSQWV